MPSQDANQRNTTDCIFCRIVHQEAEASVVYEDEGTIAFLDTNPIAAGHTLVVPKEHYADIFDMESDVLQRLILATKTVALRMRDLLGADGVNILNASGRAAEQDVFHFHVHVIPRKEEDSINFNEWWAKKVIRAERTDLNKLATKLRKA